MRTNKFKRLFAFLKGMNRDVVPTRLDEQELYTIQNCRVNVDGTVQSRYGHSKQNTTQIAAGNGNMIAQLKESDGNKRLVVQFLTSIYAYIISSWTSIASTITDAIMNWIQFKDKLIMGNGVDNVKSYGKETVYVGAGETRDYFHLTRSGIGWDLIAKANVTGKSVVLYKGYTGSGTDEFNFPIRSCVVGDYIYIADAKNGRIVKRTKTDYTYVNQITGLYGPCGVCSDGTYLYVICDRAGSASDPILFKYRLSDLVVISSSYVSDYRGVDICTDNTNLYFLLKKAGSDALLYKTDLTFSSGTSQTLTGQTFFDYVSNDISSGICYYNSNIYLTDASKTIRRFDTSLAQQATNTISNYAYACTSNASGLYVITSTGLPAAEAVYTIYDYNLTTLAVGSYSYTPGVFTERYIGLGITIETVSGALSTETQYLVRDIGTPNACGTVAKITGSNPNGTYYYKITWKIGSLESSGGPVSNPVTVATKAIELSGIESPSWLNAISGAKIRIYRTKAGTTEPFYYVKEINAGTAMPIEDDVADAALGAAIPTMNSLVPQMRYFAEYQNHIFGAGYDSDRSMLYISGLYSDDDWYDADSGTLRFIRVYENDGDIIKGLSEYYGGLYIFKRDSVHYLTGTYPNYSVVRIKRGRGTISHRTIKEYKRRLFWLSERGIEMLDGAEPTTITDGRIQSVIETINKGQEELSFAFIYHDRYYLYIPTGSSTYCDTCIVYNFITNSYIVDTGINAISGGLFEDDNDYELAYVADNYGFLWRVEDENYRNDGVPSGTVNGTATSGGANTLTQTTASFYYPGSVSGLAGCSIYIISGTGAGQTRTISSNTGTIITVSTDWTTQPNATSVYTIGAIDCSLVSGKYSLSENYEQCFREIESEDKGSGVLNYSVQVEGRTAETFSKTITSDYINYRYGPTNQWGKWCQVSISQRKANDYFVHQGHTFWYKIKGDDKEG